MRSVNLSILWLILTLHIIMIVENRMFMIAVKKHAAIENLLRKASSFEVT